jgi:hypothetical protein
MKDLTRALTSISELCRTLADDASGHEPLTASDIEDVLAALKATIQTCQAAMRNYETRCPHRDANGTPTVFFDRDPVDPTASGWICSACGSLVGHRTMSAEAIALAVHPSKE